MPATPFADAIAAHPETVDCPACGVPLVARALVASAVHCINSRVLLDGRRELVIRHRGSDYHLRLTRNDKLILTK
ncbi:MAG: hemin uptake protein HemP [Rhodanobacter sp.]|nr:MAG: hemin uptake protein HemP [Rhodanobacter sp.]TAM13217.1 MAG: hemin uptake protein HemP [Rhodanobacter sp.]TAM35363.1 MAG: hemin uptake protein HemP [Rhodanobacter sp.]